MIGAVTVRFEDGLTKTLTEGDTLTFAGGICTILSIMPVPNNNNSESIDLDDPFEAAVWDLVKMNRKKRRDYAQDGDPFSNFRATSDHFGFSPWESAEFNLVQKLTRLASLQANGRMEEPENESVADTYLDAAVYAVIMYAIYRNGYRNCNLYPNLYPNLSENGE